MDSTLNYDLSYGNVHAGLSLQNTELRNDDRFYEVHSLTRYIFKISVVNASIKFIVLTYLDLFYGRYRNNTRIKCVLSLIHI